MLHDCQELSQATRVAGGGCTTLPATRRMPVASTSFVSKHAGRSRIAPFNWPKRTSATALRKML